MAGTAGHRRRGGWVLFVAVAIVAASAVATDRQPGGDARHVVLVTIDGLRGDYLGGDDRYGLKIPTLRRLMRDGARSERTISVFPTLTGPAHTSLVTGTWTAKHGILGNNRFDVSGWRWDRDNYDAQPPYGQHALIHVRTLWSAARARGLTTAAIAWPQTEGGPIDYRLDIRLGPTGHEARARTLATASPGWVDRIEARLGPLVAVDARGADHLKALVGAELLRQFRPALLAVHLSQTDSVQHSDGPGTPTALSALEAIDHDVAALLAPLEDPALRATTTVFITGDHGFLPMHTQLAINLPLVEAGLIERGPADAPLWRAIVAPHRGLGSLYVRAGDRAAAARAREALARYEARYPGRFRLLERHELDAFGADRDAVLGVEPYEGYVLDGRLAPPFALPHDRAAGHGYRPDRPGMETGLIIWGAGVRRGVVLPVSYTIDVAPTIAELLGLDLLEADGHSMVGALTR